MPAKIVITGPESTGKSQLTIQLASRLKAPHVLEQARFYLQDLGRPYTESDMHIMAANQTDAERMALESGSPLIVCDTDLLTFVIWWEVKYGRCPVKWMTLWRENLPDLYLLTDIDMPWEDDPLREHPHMREDLKNRYIEKLKSANAPFAIVSGQGNSRLHSALTAIEKSQINY